MTFGERKDNWLGHAQRLAEVALEVIAQCDNLDATKGTKDPKVIALTVLSRSLGHFKATFRLIECGLIVEHEPCRAAFSKTYLSKVVLPNAEMNLCNR
jgi:hypothetical protein